MEQGYSNPASPAEVITSPTPAWSAEAEPTPAASRDAQVKEAGRAAASGWKMIDKAKSDRLLRKRWSAVNRTIRGSVLHGPAVGATGQSVADVYSSALLLSVLRELSDSMPEYRRLPVVETRDHEILPRVYAMARTYLQAAGFAFDEREFVRFLLGVQEVAGLALGELWALRAMLQLALLEQIGGAAQPSGREGKNSFSVGGLIDVFRALAYAPWRDICEQLSEVDRVLRDDPSGAYPRMNPQSRDDYLMAVRELGRASPVAEPEIARRAVALARSAQQEWISNPRVRDRHGHVGYYLVGHGRTLLEQQIACRPPFAERVRATILAWPEIYYFVGLEVLTLAILAFLLLGARSPASLMAGLLLVSLPASEAAWGVMNQLAAFILRPCVLPKLDFSNGIPAECATMVVVPTLLLNEKYVREMVQGLEVRFLANRESNLYFALLTDAPDAALSSDPGDELVTLCSSLIGELNRRYASRGSPFFLFHRFRTFNPSEGAWMGWERKRGKLLDFNDLLRADGDSFPVKVGDLSVLPRIKYVITLDSDTQLPRGVAGKLVGTLAHPLNRAVVDPLTRTVVAGYGILQPRVGISIQSANRSLLAAIYSGQTGLDPYTRAISDIYQDLFGEGNFVGKGIYEVDVLRQVLKNRFPTNAILSHDLIEGSYARAGLVSDIEVVDDYPTHFNAHSRRKHRWVRGDWQIMLWLLPRVPNALGKKVSNPLSLLSRWRILDNLRRSLVEVATFALLLAGWFSLPGSPRRWTLAVIVLLLLPVYLQLLFSLLKLKPGENVQGKLREIADNFVSDQINVFFFLAFLTHQTLVMLDAILRTIVRVTITRKNLLEWETAAQATAATKRTPVDVYLAWTPWLSLFIGLLLAVLHRAALPQALPLLVLWACAGPLARWLDRPLPLGRTKISEQQERFLRGACLRTWRFFRQSTEESSHGLVPDNIQENPARVAHTISPTNLGLLLNAQLAACEMGYLTLPEFVRAAEKILETARRLRRFNGHFVNWYSTQTLEPLNPQFVSTVDSGNLACSLWTLKHGCLQAIAGPLLRASSWQGLGDCLALLQELASAGGFAPAKTVLDNVTGRLSLVRDHPEAWINTLPQLAQELEQLKHAAPKSAAEAEEWDWWLHETVRRMDTMADLLVRFTPWLSPHSQTLVNGMRGKLREPTLSTVWSEGAELDLALGKVLENAASDTDIRSQATLLRRRLPLALAEADKLRNRLARLADEADRLVQEMDFRFLYNCARKLFSIGFSLERQKLEPSHYDLLASEARSAAFVAIAKGDVPQDAWFQMGRPQALWEGQSFLLSWSGSMFEYLMPTLWLEQYPRTLLDHTARVVVRCQEAWVKPMALPWGTSEAAFQTQDAEGRYQYRAFGVPVLALNPGPKDDIVISPYAAFLALPVDPESAVKNLMDMQRRQWLGKMGFYDAVDFTPERAKSRGGTVVRTWMAHHQGMSLLAICNLLTDGAVQKLFHSEPAVAATELLLHEKPLLAVHPLRRATRADAPPAR